MQSYRRKSIRIPCFFCAFLLRLLSLLYALLVPCLFAGESITLRLGPSINLSSAGLRLTPFAHYDLRPIHAPKARLYVKSISKTRFEAYRLPELWAYRQTKAFLSGDAGTITIARLQWNPLAHVPLIHGRDIREVDFNAACRQQKPKWDQEAIRNWVETFTGQNVILVSKKVKGLTLNYPYLVFSFENSEEMQMKGFVILLPGRPTFLLLAFRQNVSIRNIKTAIFRLLRSLKPIQLQTKALRPHRQLQDQKVWKKMNGHRSEEHEAARQRVITSLQNLKGWWYVETPNYILTSNLKKNNRRLVDLIQRDIEKMRSAYARLVPPVEKVKDVSVIRIFSTLSGYRDYVDKEMRWSSGMWDPSRRELVLAPSSKLQSSRQVRQQVLSIVYHEAFHQYLFYALAQRNPPIWFNEGHAVFFEAAKVDSRTGKIIIPENQARLSILLPMFKQAKSVDLSRIMSMSRERFYQLGNMKPNAARLRQQHYALAWGLVYFLRKAAPLYPQHRYAEICPAIVRELNKSGDWRKAAQAGIAVVRIPILQRDFNAFWNSKSMRRKAARIRLFSSHHTR